jgi:hypothetical protein
MATIRHAARNLIQTIADKASLKASRKTLAWNDTYLEPALRPDIQLSSDFFGFCAAALLAINKAIPTIQSIHVPYSTTPACWRLTSS